ncbi:MAG TPA: hypothetical protein VKB14_02415 [Actinomycetales bacterium]|nr:hypothetical protein [Actinomycetales bacterium]
MSEFPGPDFDESVDDVTLAAMRAILGLVTRVEKDGPVTSSDVLAALTGVLRAAGMGNTVPGVGSVPAHEVDRIVGHCLAAGFHIVRVLLAHVEARWGISAETLLDDFERELNSGED